MAQNYDEIKNRIREVADEVQLDLYDNIRKATLNKYKARGLNEDRLEEVVESEAAMFTAAAIMGENIRVNDDSVVGAPGRLFDPDSEQKGFINEVIQSGLIKGNDFMTTLRELDRVEPGTIRGYRDFDKLNIDQNDLRGMMMSTIDRSMRADVRDETEFYLNLMDNDAIREKTGLADGWLADMSNTMDPGNAAVMGYIDNLSALKTERDNNSEIMATRKHFEGTWDRLASTDPKRSYADAVNDLRGIVSDIKILSDDKSPVLGTIKPFTLSNGSQLIIMPIEREGAEPLVMGIYTTEEIAPSDIDLENPPEGMIFYPADTPEMEALVKASGGFSRVEYNRQMKYEALVKDVSDALKFVNSDDKSGLKEKAERLYTEMQRAVETAKESGMIDEKDIKGVLDGVQVETIDGHRLTFDYKDGTMDMYYLEPSEKTFTAMDMEARKIDMSQPDPMSPIPDTGRVEYFVNMADFDQTVKDAKKRIVETLKGDKNLDSMTMSVVRHTTEDIANFKFSKAFDEKGKSILTITDVTDPSNEIYIGSTDVYNLDERGDLDWVYYGATEAVMGEPYNEKEKVDKALERGTVTILNEKGLPSSYKIERDNNGKVIGIDGNNKHVRAENVVAKEEAPEVLLIGKLRSTLVNREAVELIRSQGFKGFVDNLERRGHDAQDEITIYSPKGKTTVTVRYDKEQDKYELSAEHVSSKLDKNGRPVVSRGTQTLTKDKLVGSKTLVEKITRIAKNMTKTVTDPTVKAKISLRDRLGKVYGIDAEIMRADRKKLMNIIKENNKMIIRLAKTKEKESKQFERFAKFAEKKGINYMFRENKFLERAAAISNIMEEFAAKNNEAIEKAVKKAENNKEH